jgi:hypothetical protein
MVTNSVLEDIIVSTERRIWFLYEYLKDTNDPGDTLVLVDELCKKPYQNGHLPSTANWPWEFVDEVEWLLPEK